MYGFIWFIALIVSVLITRWVFKIDRMVKLQEQQVFLLKELIAKTDQKETTKKED